MQVTALSSWADGHSIESYLSQSFYIICSFKCITAILFVLLLLLLQFWLNKICCIIHDLVICIAAVFLSTYKQHNYLHLHNFWNVCNISSYEISYL